MLSAIERLCELLDENNIPYTKEKQSVIVIGDCVIISRDGHILCDAVLNNYSLGRENNLLEIMGGLTEEESEYDSVKGYLTPEEVCKRFIYCYNNNTSVYVEEDN